MQVHTLLPNFLLCRWFYIFIFLISHGPFFLVIISLWFSFTQLYRLECDIIFAITADSVLFLCSTPQTIKGYFCIFLQCMEYGLSIEKHHSILLKTVYYFSLDTWRLQTNLIQLQSIFFIF